MARTKKVSSSSTNAKPNPKIAKNNNSKRKVVQKKVVVVKKPSKANTKQTQAVNSAAAESGTSYFNEKFDRVDQDQGFACISVVGPDVIQKARNENGDIHPVHGLVVWATLASDSGPEADKVKAAASHACGGLLDVYIVKTCAMLPLKFSLEDFSLANSSWADSQVDELMSGLRRSKELTQKFFDERREHLQNNSTNEAMVGEELQRLQSDLEKLNEEKVELQNNIAVYEAKLAKLGKK